MRERAQYIAHCAGTLPQSGRAEFLRDQVPKALTRWECVVVEAVWRNADLGAEGVSSDTG